MTIEAQVIEAMLAAESSIKRARELCGQVPPDADVYMSLNVHSGEEVRLELNRAGAIYLALRCLYLARCGSSGSHEHFDDSILENSRAEMTLILKSFKSPAD